MTGWGPTGCGGSGDGRIAYRINYEIRVTELTTYGRGGGAGWARRVRVQVRQGKGGRKEAAVGRRGVILSAVASPWASAEADAGH